MFAVTCLLPSVLYLPNRAVLAGNPANTTHLGKYNIRQAAFQVYNMEIKYTFPFDRAHTKYNNIHNNGIVITMYINIVVTCISM